jgi:hypothetical protein
MAKCCFCERGPQDGVTVYRVNAKGEAGIWACREHRQQADAPPTDPEVQRLVNAIEGASR